MTTLAHLLPGLFHARLKSFGSFGSDALGEGGGVGGASGRIPTREFRRHIHEAGINSIRANFNVSNIFRFPLIQYSAFNSLTLPIITSQRLSLQLKLSSSLDLFLPLL